MADEQSGSGLPQPLRDGPRGHATDGSWADRLRYSALDRLTRGVDAFYVAFQAALKTNGLVGGGPVPSPEESDEEGGRFAVLSRRQDRWPELRVPLPDAAVYWYSVESLFRRAGLWRALVGLEDVRQFFSEHLGEAWAAGEVPGGSGTLRYELEGGGVENLVKVAPLSDGGVVVSVGQKIGRLRFQEAEHILHNSTRDADTAAET